MLFVYSLDSSRHGIFLSVRVIRSFLTLLDQYTHQLVIHFRWANDMTHIGLESLAYCVIALQKAVPLAKYQRANLPPSLQYQPPSECPSPVSCELYYTYNIVGIHVIVIF